MKQKKILKRALSLLLAIVLVAGTITVVEPKGSAVAEAAGENLITNGGFDSVSGWAYTGANGSTDDVPAQEQEPVMVPNYVWEDDCEDSTKRSRWYDYNNDGTVEVEIDQDDANNYVASFTNTHATNTGLGYKFDNGSFAKGETYTISFRYKGSAQFQVFTLGFFQNAYDAFDVQTPLSADDWTICSFEVTPTMEASTSQAQRLMFQMRTTSGGTFYIDDLKVAHGEVTKTEEVYAINSDFSGAVLPDFVRGRGTGNVTLEEGRLKVSTVKGDNGVSFTIPVESEKTYTISYKLVFGSQFCTNSMVQAHVNGTSYTGATYFSAATGIWGTAGTEKDISITYTVPSSKTHITYTLYHNDGANDGLYYVDDFAVYYKTDATTYTQGIGDCKVNGVATEDSSVLYMEDYASVTTSAEIEANKKYQYTFDAKLQTGSDVDLDIHVGGTKVADVDTSELLATEWKKGITGTFTTTADADTFGFLRSGDGVYIDNVSLVEVPGDHTPLLESDYIPSGAETLRYVDFTTSSSGVAFLSVTTEDGVACMAMSDQSNYMQLAALNAEKGHTYVFAFYIWIQNVGEKFQLDIAQGNVGTGGPTGTKEILHYLMQPSYRKEYCEVTVDGKDATASFNANTNGWKKVEVTWTAKANDQFDFYVKGYTSTATVYIDDVVVYDNSAAAAKEEVLLGYYDLGSENEGYLVSATSDTEVTIKKADGTTETVEAGEYKPLNGAGDYTLTRGDETTEVALYRRGDVNAEHDQNISAKDLIAAKKKIAEVVIGSADAKAADVNADGVLNDSDAEFMREALVNDYDLIGTQKGIASLGQGVMPIIGVNGPDTAEGLANVSELGINSIVVNTADISENEALAEELLAEAEKNNMKVYLNCDNATSPDSDDQITDAASLSAMNSAYDNYTSFAGYYVADDVYYKKQSTSDTGTYFANNGIADYKKVLKSAANYLNVDTYLNLLPASSQALGYSMSGNEASTTVTYEQYLAYAKAASDAGSAFLPYSMLLKADSTYELQQEAFYTNLDWARSISFDENVNKPFYATVQTGVDFHDENKMDTDTDKLLTMEEMYLEANAALAMGAKGIQYNAVIQQDEWADNHGDTEDPHDYNRSGLLNAKGEPNLAYYVAAQKLNNYIGSIDYILMDAENKGVIATNNNIAGYISGAKIDKFGVLESVYDTASNAMVGCFDYFGKDTFFVTNTSVDTDTTVTLTFSEAVDGIVKTFDGTSETFKAQTTYEVTLSAGESTLIVVEYRSGDAGANVEEAPTEEEISLAAQTTLADTIETANELVNDVQAYYTNSAKTSYTIENQNMKLTYSTQASSVSPRSLTSITNKNGVAYPTYGESFDIIVKYDNTNYYCSKTSTTDAWINTTKLGYYYYETNLWDLDFGENVPNLYLEKAYHTYPDKMHQAFRVISNSADTDKVTAITFRTIFKVSEVNEMEMLTKTGEKIKTVTSEASATNLEYAGFYFDGVGVIGFITAAEGTSLQVTTDGTYYYVSQNVNANAIDFTSGEVSFGNRVYTDAATDAATGFAGLQAANEEEQNPLTDAQISVTNEADGAAFTGYDHLTGAYTFTMDGQSFGDAHSDGQKKFYADIKVTGVNDERILYLDVHTDNPAEAATLVQNNKQIPIPLQVGKNFANENTKEVYHTDLIAYADTYLPLCVKPEMTYEFSVVNVYEDWGSQEIRLKQLSSIEYYNSYYHLSTGIRETNCIAPYYATKNYEEYYKDTAWIMPDFRGPSTSPQPTSPEIQNMSVGVLRGPSNGNYLATYQSSDIHSAGLTYADLEYTYQSDDGKYEYTIRHVEMPQEDEARTYYTIEFTMLQDCTLNKGDFEIIGFNGAHCVYNKVAYLNTNRQHKEPYLWPWEQNWNLNQNGSYFALYDLGLLDDSKNPEVGNLGVIVKQSDVALALHHEYFTPNYWQTKNQNYAALTLANNTEFKKGDTFKVEMILLPFGTQGQDNCQNVIDVYNDSVVNPLTISAETGAVVDDTFVPTVKAEDNVADFTLTGGVTEDNTDGVIYTVKVTNFETLGNPVIQEYVDGQWKTYEYYTELGYDGYSVEYEDGRLSYSFAFKQTDATEGRRFRVIKPKDANVNYYVNGEMIKSVNVKAEQTVAQPTDAELDIIGHKILGFYTDEAYVNEYEFGQYLTGDMNVCVEVSDELYISAEQLETFKASFADTKTVSDGTLILGTEQTQVNMYLFARDLNIDVSKTPTLKLTIPSVTNVSSMFVKLMGTYIDGAGETQTVEVTSEVENKNDWDNWNTTRYVLYPNANNKVLTKSLTAVFDSTTTISSYLTITGIMLYTNPADNTKAQELQVTSIECVRDEVHTVTYVANGETVKTETVNDGQKLSVPTDMDTCVMGYQVQGYYRDAEYTTKYDFGNWITEDTTVYVKTSETFYLGANALSEFSKNLVDSTTIADDGAFTVIGTGNDTYICYSSLQGINIASAQRIEVKAKLGTNATSLQIFLMGAQSDGTSFGYSNYYMTAVAGTTDSDGYTTYYFDISDHNTIKSIKTLTGFRIDINGSTTEAKTVDIMYARAVAVPTE